MAQGQGRVAVAGKDDLALLGKLEVAVHRPRGLREDRTVCRTAPASHGTPTTVHEHKVNVHLFGPARDALLGTMQDERRGRRTLVLGRV